MVKTKICNRCQQSKSHSEFYKDRAVKDGLYSICKACKGKSLDEWREKNRIKYNESMRKYRAKNYRKMHLNRYKITVAQYELMIEQQKGLCKICGKSAANKKRPLAIDHCHKTGRVRGLLCYGCNRLMVLLDDPILYNRATEYLRLFNQDK